MLAKLNMFIVGTSLVVMLMLASAARAIPPSAPDDVPEVLFSQATDYTIQAPKLFYLYNPACAPILADGGGGAQPELDRAGGAREVGGENQVGMVTQFVGRTAVYGAPPRQMYDYTFDTFCNPPDEPDIISDIVADDDSLYWVSNQQNALVKISENRLDWETTLPDVVYAHTARASELVLLDDTIYMLQIGAINDGLYQVNKNTGAATQLLTSAQTGTNPNNFQTDGEFLYWRYWTGSEWNLRAYDLDAPGTDILASDVMSYYPVAGNVVYIGFPDVIRSYDHGTGTLSSPLYTSATTSLVTGIVADGSGLYFIQQQVCSPACPGAYTLYRLPFGSSSPTALYAPPITSPVTVMHNLQRHENSLFFLHGEELKQIATNAGQATLTNMRIDSLEITQAIQSDGNSVDLVQGKRTAVRLFASSDGDSIPGVYARLYRINGSGTIIDGPLSPINLERDSLYLRLPSEPDKDNINESYTFFLPPTWMDDPTLRLQAELNPFRFPPEPTYSDNVLQTTTFNLDASERFEAHFILFQYDSGGSRIAPRYAEDYLQAVSWVRRTYPIASAPGSYADPSPGFRPKVSWLYDENLGGNVDGTDRDPDCQRRIDLDPGEDGFLDDPSLCAAWYVVCPTLDSIRAAESIPSEIQLVGMVSDEAGFARGWACGGGVSTPTGLATTDPATRNWGWDFDGSYGDWYAGHEIGHSQGRGHPSSGNECGHSASDGGYPWPDAEIGDESYRGFDMGDMGLNSLLVPRVYPNEWHDMMGYCMAPGQWISNYTYLGIKSFLEATAVPSFAQPAGGAYLQLSGVIYPDAHEADMIQVRLWDALSSPPTPSAPGPYRIRLLDSGNGELAAVDFTPTEAEGNVGLIMGEFVPFVVGTARVEVTHPASGDLLWSYDVSSSAPVVSDVQLVGAPSPVTGEVTVQWSATDADGDDLAYDVLYSADGGVSWKMVQMGLTSMSAVVDTAVLAGSNQAHFKIIANDGFNQGEDMSAAFTVVAKAPVITVLTPYDGEAFAFGQEVFFLAEVLDYQDGSVADSDIVWRDQTNFTLGIGTEFSQDNLLIGENIITVTATNSEGLSSEVTFSIFVNDELEQPTATLTVGPDQVGWHVAAGETAVQMATITVANSGADGFTVTTMEDAPWLSVSQSGSSTPLQLTLTADPAYLEPGQALSTMLQVEGTSSSGTETVLVPVGFAMGFVSDPVAGGYELFLPFVTKP